MDQNAILEARGLLNMLEDFQFVFHLFVYNKIFTHTQTLFEILQRKSSDVLFCQQQIDHTYEIINSFRTDEVFNLIFEDVVKLIDVPTVRNARRNLGSEVSVQQEYKMFLFEIIDNILCQLKTRFSDFKKIRFVDLLSIKNFDIFKKHFPESCFQSLVQQYASFFDLQKLKNELIVLYGNNTLYSDCSNIEDLLRNILDQEIDSVFPQSTKLMKLVLTIPPTSVGAERSFSALKRIKTYLRNSIGQENLNNLGLMSIEKELIKKLQKNLPKQQCR